MSRAAAVRKADIRRALDALKDAGRELDCITIRAGGEVVITALDPARRRASDPALDRNEWDDVFQGS